MSSTRHSVSGDFADAPERNLSSRRNRPLNVSLAIAARAARVFTKEPRYRHAILWLANVAANSQRIQLCWQRRHLPDPLGTIGRITEADLAELLGLEVEDIYRALTGHDDADMERFTKAVERFRFEVFEASLPPLVKTRDTAIIAEAFDSAATWHNTTTVQAKWRHGKTEECERIWLMNLHRCVWLHTPCDNTDATFIAAVARILGISTGGGKKNAQIWNQVVGAFGIGLIECVMIDEAHNLFPADLVTAKPIRVERVRELRDSLGVGSVKIVTEQFALAMELAKQHNTRYAPGQVAGRRDQYKLHDIHTDAEIRAIARLHAGKIEEDALDGLVEFAKKEEGYLGVMVQAIERARRAAGETPEGRTITGLMVAQAIKQEQTDERIVKIAKASRKSRRGRFDVLDGGKEAA